MNRFKQLVNILSQKSYGSAIFYDRPDDEAPKSWGKTDFLRANEISLYTNRAIAKRAEKVSEVEFTLKRVKTDETVDNHVILDLLNKPNKYMTGLQFWGLYSKYRDLAGAAYIWMEPSGEIFDKNKFAGMHLLRPDCVTILYKDGEIVGFRHSFPNGGKSIDIPAEQVVYLYTPNPLNPLEGISLLAAGIRAIDTEVQLSAYQSNVLRNGGNVGNIITFKTALTQKQIAELKDGYAAQWAGAKNAGRPMFMGGEAAIQKLGLNPEELSYLETKKVILDDIIIMTGVPRAVLGVSSGETFSNADASVAIFQRETIKPILADLVSILDWRLVPEDLELGFVDPTPENVELRLKRVDTGLSKGYMTINEARELDGLEPIPDGDVLLVPSTVRPLEQALKEPEPVNPNPNDQNPPKEGKSLKEHPLKDAYVREKYAQIVEKRMDRAEAKVLEAIKYYFVGQRQRIIGYLDENTRKRKDLLENAFNHTLEIRLAKDTLLPLIRETLRRAGIDAKELAGSAYDFVLSERIESFLDQRANVFASQITETTFEKLKSEFAASLDAQESRQQLIKRIRDTYEGYDEARARTIARTEVHAVTQTGTMEGYRQAGLKTKIWVAVGDAATRDAHRAVDGQEVPFHMPFNVGGESLMYPGDPNGSAENVINCRCSI